MSHERIRELRTRVKRAEESVAAFERIESELRSMCTSDDPDRRRELLRANADSLNGSRARLAIYVGELVQLLGARDVCSLVQRIHCFPESRDLAPLMRDCLFRYCVEFSGRRVAGLSGKVVSALQQTCDRLFASSYRFFVLRTGPRHGARIWHYAIGYQEPVGRTDPGIAPGKLRLSPLHRGGLSGAP